MAGDAILDHKLLTALVGDVCAKWESEGKEFRGLWKLQDALCNWFVEQYQAFMPDIEQQPEDSRPKLILSGFSPNRPGTGVITLGDPIKKAEKSNEGFSCIGYDKVVSLMEMQWESGVDHARRPYFSRYSLQDGIDFARYLINTTAGYCRFALDPAIVRKPIDIGVVTRRGGFEWVKRRKLK